MTPKSCKYVDQKTQDNFSCKHENTRKSMEFPMLWKYFWPLNVVKLWSKYRKQSVMDLLVSFAVLIIYIVFYVHVAV